MKKNLLLIMLCFIITGCATPKYNYMPKTRMQVKPELNTYITKNAGEIILEQGEALEYDAILLKEKAKTMSFGGYTFYPGYYFKKGEDKKSEYYLSSNKEGSGKVEKGMLNDPFQIIKIVKENGFFYAVTVFNVQVLVPSPVYEKVVYPVIKNNTLQKTLTYNGLEGDKVVLGYREFMGDYSRPQVKKILKGAPSEKGELAYKGARIKVIEATDEYIEYKVLSNLS